MGVTYNLKIIPYAQIYNVLRVKKELGTTFHVIYNLVWVKWIQSNLPENRKCHRNHYGTVLRDKEGMLHIPAVFVYNASAHHSHY